MKKLEAVTFDPQQCWNEINRFGKLLSDKDELSEKKDVLPLFQSCQNLTLLLGVYHGKIIQMNRIASEYDLWGDFKCDFVVGDWENKAYCFVEFEDAKIASLFNRSGRHTPEWGKRFEHGFSQIVDWAYKLSDVEKNDEFVARFGSSHIDSGGLLVVGRDAFLEPPEVRRLEWRRRHVVVNSLPVLCLTYDELYKDMIRKMHMFSAAAEADTDNNG
ncbi:Shedu anti-phage system protein SduA domain-containing protein [Chloroflexota bacterium]